MARDARGAAPSGGTLYRGDNLEVLRRHVPDESVDLVYLDPPFQSGRNYHMAFESRAGSRAGAPVRAFKDTWAWGPASEEAYQGLCDRGGRPAAAARALRGLLGESDIMAYLCMMAPRLVELSRVLRPTGSLFLHCDPTASHYLKVLLDAVLGPACFRNEVVWRYRRWPAVARQFQKMHDVLLFYSRSPSGGHKFQTLYGYEQLAESTRKTFGTRKQRADFSSGHRKPGVEGYETPGPPLSDVWEIGVIAAIGKERLGYPTQKPEALLERVILSSTEEGDVVLDPFCGCGTAVAVAQRLKRRWVGIDVTHLALSLVKHRLRGSFGGNVAFEALGEPRTVEEARKLAAESARELSWWLLGRVGARPAEPAAGTSGGESAAAQGRLSFPGEASGRGRGQQVLVSVAAGAATRAHVEELRGALSRGEAQIAVLLSLDAAGPEVAREAAAAGLHGEGRARLQLLTVEEVLAGKGIDLPVEGEEGAAKGPGLRRAGEPARRRAAVSRGA